MVKAIFNKQQNDKAKQQDLYLKIYTFCERKRISMGNVKR